MQMSSRMISVGIGRSVRWIPTDGTDGRSVDQDGSESRFRIDGNGFHDPMVLSVHPGIVVHVRNGSAVTGAHVGSSHPLR